MSIKITVMDAGAALCLNFGRYLPGANESGRWIDHATR